MDRRFIIPVALVLVGIVLNIGCAIKLRDGSAIRDDFGHKPVDDQFIAGLTPGITTAEGVCLNLGRPNWEFNGGRILVYSWLEGRQRTVGHGICGNKTDSTETVGSDAKHHHLLMEFDAEGKLVRSRVFEDGEVDPHAADFEHAVLPSQK